MEWNGKWAEGSNLNFIILLQILSNKITTNNCLWSLQLDTQEQLEKNVLY